MGIIAKKSSGPGVQAPEGVHRAACVGLYDVGTQESGNPKYAPSRRVVIVWELVDELMPDGRPFVVSREFGLNLSDKGRLKPVLESWRGRPFSDQEFQGFDLVDVLGKQCQVQVLHNDRGYANVDAVMRLAKGMAPIHETFNKPTVFSLDDQRGPEVDFPDAMPEWIREKAKKSPEYKAILDGEVVPDDGGVVDEDSDIPF